MENNQKTIEQLVKNDLQGLGFVFAEVNIPLLTREYLLATSPIWQLLIKVTANDLSEREKDILKQVAKEEKAKPIIAYVKNGKITYDTFGIDLNDYNQLSGI